MNPNYIEHHPKLHDISQPIGIYFGILVSQKSLQSIYQWCLEYGIDMTNNTSPYENRIHATIFCAKQHHGKTSVRNHWTRKFTRVIVLGNHSFYKEI